MSTDITVVSQDEINALAALTGSNSENLSGGGDYLPQLKVNYDDEDENGNEIKPGLFVVTGQDIPVYAKNVVIRPLLQHFQWVHYTKADGVVNRTRFIKNFGEEARDELGTIRCGKPTSKEIKANPALKEKFEDINVYRTVHVLVSYEGETATGEKAKVENVVAVMRLKGSNFSPFQEEHTDLMPKGSNLWDYSVKLSTKKEKNGASTYYVIHFEGDFSSRLPMTQDVLDTIKGLHERVEQINADVDAKYYAALQDRDLDDEAVSKLKTIGEILDADEEIPF